ncbi:MAG: 2-oxoglutarate ferredoxin oxidoreductase subunit beta [Synergistetes bacterium]|nr:2-oxoglutarate ferredoxin oxidoreductase subunit beta [Synergistota bacterium]
MLDIKRYLRLNKLPHIWCPGCGNGSIVRALVTAIDRLGYKKDEVVVFTGIGCSARTNAILDFNTIQTTHGRTLAFATGFKMMRPEMKVIVITGDGDGAAIGGNHLIHAARRNIDITTILINNNIYGMTGGQYSPLSPQGVYATTAPYGNVEPPFDICELVRSAGATFVARGTVYHIYLTMDLITKALSHKGFSFVEVVSQCPIGFGRRNNMRSPYEMLLWQREHAVSVKEAEKYSKDELRDKFLIGELWVNPDRPEFVESYNALRERALGQAKGGDL